jgi:hypothetical protein
MINPCSIYRNPQIPSGYFYAKVIDLQTEPMEGYVMPKVLVKLKLHSDHGLGDNVVLSAIVYPTPKAKFFYMNFLNTFLTNDEVDVEKVKNRWGCIKVYPTKYGQTEYSAVQWIYQLPPVKQQIAKIIADENY